MENPNLSAEPSGRRPITLNANADKIFDKMKGSVPLVLPPRKHIKWENNTTTEEFAKIIEAVKKDKSLLRQLFSQPQTQKHCVQQDLYIDEINSNLGSEDDANNQENSNSNNSQDTNNSFNDFDGGNFYNSEHRSNVTQKRQRQKEKDALLKEKRWVRYTQQAHQRAKDNTHSTETIQSYMKLLQTSIETFCSAHTCKDGSISNSR